MRRAGVLLGLAGTGLGAYAYNDDGLRRTFSFWSRVMPVYAHYRFTEYSVTGSSEAVQDAEFHRLHALYASDIRDLTLELKGFYLKLAQVCSTRDEFIPAEYMRWCKELQDRVPETMALEEVRAIVERELGAPVEQVFDSFDDKPIGAASIGQVHRGTLPGGKQVAVKIQFPGIEDKFRLDVATIKRFCSFAMPQHLPFLDEIEKQFMTEFDYKAEAVNLQTVGDNLGQSAEWSGRVVVPQPVMSLCTKSVLVMDFLQGASLVDGVQDYYRDMSARLGRSASSIATEQANRLSLVQFSVRSRLLHLWLGVEDFFYNLIVLLKNTCATLCMSSTTFPYRYTPKYLDLSSIMDQLLRVHGYEIFHDGTFNGDPHPGNVMLLPDNRLGLVDYGQVKVMSLESRIKFAKLIIALDNDDKDRIVDIVKNEMGIQTLYMNPEIIYRSTVFWYDRDTSEITGGRNIHKFLEWLDQQDPVTVMCDDYVMAGRVAFLLRGVANAFGVQLKVAQYWRPYAEQLLEKHGVQQ